MTYTRPKADVVIVGLGWAGSLMAEELTRAGLNTVAIERGVWEEANKNYPPSIAADELRYGARREALKPPSVETLTFRNNPRQTALPGRDFNIWQMGFSVGGAGKHWAANAWRFNPSDFIMATRVKERYHNMPLADGLIVQDWGVTYDDLEAHYDRWEKIAGIAGKAGVINGQAQAGGNPFEARAPMNTRHRPWHARIGMKNSARPPKRWACTPSLFRQVPLVRLIPTRWASTWRRVLTADSVGSTAAATGLNPRPMPA